VRARNDFNLPSQVDVRINAPASCAESGAGGAESERRLSQHFAKGDLAQSARASLWRESFAMSIRRLGAACRASQCEDQRGPSRKTFESFHAHRLSEDVLYPMREVSPAKKTEM